jgi:hypothetical protein
MSVLTHELDNLCQRKVFQSLGTAVRFRPSASSSVSRREISTLRPGILDVRTVFEAAIVLRDLADEYARLGYPTAADLEDVEVEPKEENLDKVAVIARLKKIVPEQKLAPAQFDVVKNKVTISKSKSGSAEEDRLNIEAARESIVKSGKEIIDSLRSSNCDNRLLESVQNLHQQIVTNASAVQVGISNISCGIIADQFQGELPDALVGKIKAHNISIGMFVAQFPDWTRFSENAASAEIDQRDAEDVDRAAKNIISYLDSNKDIADPSVVKAFRELRNISGNPNKAAKRALFAVIRTIENLASKVFQFAISYLEQTTKQTVDGLAKATSKIIIGSMVALAITGASSILGLTSKISELSWLNTAIEMVQKQMKDIK